MSNILWGIDLASQLGCEFVPQMTVR